MVCPKLNTGHECGSENEHNTGHVPEYQNDVCWRWHNVTAHTIKYILHSLKETAVIKHINLKHECCAKFLTINLPKHYNSDLYNKLCSFELVFFE